MSYFSDTQRPLPWVYNNALSVFLSIFTWSIAIPFVALNPAVRKLGVPQTAVDVGAMIVGITIGFYLMHIVISAFEVLEEDGATPNVGLYLSVLLSLGYAYANPDLEFVELAKIVAIIQSAGWILHIIGVSLVWLVDTNRIKEKRKNSERLEDNAMRPAFEFDDFYRQGHTTITDS